LPAGPAWFFCASEEIPDQAVEIFLRAALMRLRSLAARDPTSRHQRSWCGGTGAKICRRAACSVRDVFRMVESPSTPEKTMPCVSHWSLPAARLAVRLMLAALGVSGGVAAAPRAIVKPMQPEPDQKPAGDRPSDPYLQLGVGWGSASAWNCGAGGTRIGPACPAVGGVLGVTLDVIWLIERR
jgi:hypothetical protein